MNMKAHPFDIATTLLNRSVCAVQVAAVAMDGWGVFATGWNNAGADGFGEHAEHHCLRRANRKRLAEATLYVAARRQRNGRVVTARPCLECLKLVKCCKKVVYRDGDGEWRTL